MSVYEDDDEDGYPWTILVVGFYFGVIATVIIGILASHLSWHS